MKQKYADKQMVATHIARALKTSKKKRDQLQAVRDITVRFTGDDWVNVTVELYYGNIARYLITGTRSGMTVTMDIRTAEIIRKPKGLDPYYTTQSGLFVHEIMEKFGGKSR